MHAAIVRFLAAFLIALPAVGFADDWTPPDNPDPQAILREARDDANANRYEIALAKHLWFHENALSLNPSLSGVRLSFALSDWKKLGDKYPPALEKLTSIRDSLAERVRKGEDINSGFHDLAAINRTFGEDLRTAESFKQLDAQNPKAATNAFHFVKPALITSKDYELYVKYVDPKRDFLMMKHIYEMDKLRAEDPRFGENFAERSEKSFRNRTATLVAILAINKRNDEAAEIAALAKKELPNTAFLKELDAALAGTVPTPWP